MALDFELTISGLCLVVLKPRSERDEDDHPEEHDYPRKPEWIEVLCPVACHHRATLTYAPEGVETNLEPELVVDDRGRRFASVDLSKQVWAIAAEGAPGHVCWGDHNKTRPYSRGEEPWLDWVPRLHDLGFADESFVSAPKDQLPAGAITRLLLPKGSLVAADVIPGDAEEYATWVLSGGKQRALANRLVFSVRRLTDEVKITSTEGAFIKADGLRMALSNDMAMVPRKYNEPALYLEHLGHLKGLSGIDGDFVAPQLAEPQATAKPICNQVVHLYRGE